MLPLSRVAVSIVQLSKCRENHASLKKVPGWMRVNLLFILAEELPKLKYKIITTKPTCAMLTVLVKAERGFLPKDVP